MNKKILISIIVIVIFVMGAAIYFIFQKPAYPQLQPSVLSKYKDSPFGFHPGYVGPEDAYKNIPLPPEYFLRVSLSYEYAKDIGVNWDRPGMYLPVPPPPESGFTWQQLTDRVYSNVPTSMKIFANIDVRAWAITKPLPIPDELRSLTVWIPPLTTLELVDEQCYLKFVKELVERYDGDGFNDMPNLKNPIKYWQIDNELPGLPPSFPLSKPGDKISFSKPEDKEWLDASINNYAHILEITSKIIKSQDPTAKVAIAGMAGIAPESEELFRVYYLEVLKKLNGKYVDIFDYHAYGPWKLAKDLYRIIRQGLDSAGYKNTEIWITETGSYNGQPRGMALQTEKDQAIDLVRRLIYPLTFGVKKVFWAWCVVDDARSEGADGHMGLVYNGYGPGNPGYGVKKLSYYTYKKMIEVLEGNDWNNIQTVQESNGIYVYKFTKQGKSIWVAWNDNAQEKEIAISDISVKQVKIIEAVPKYESGKEIEDYNTAFKTYAKAVMDSNVKISLGDIPVFVEDIE